MIAITLASCSSGSQGNTAADASDSSAPKTTRIAFVAAQMHSTYFEVMKCGAKAAAAENNVDLDWQGDPDWALQTQLPLIQAAVQSKPDGLVLVPTDPKALVNTVEGIMKDGIPVITVDGSLDQPVDVQNIRTDNIDAGTQAAKQLAESIGGSGTVLVVASQPGITANQERITGFAKVMKDDYKDITVLPIAYAGDDQSTASQLVDAAITGNSDLKGIYTTLAPASNGAAAAVQASGKQGAIKIVAYDADPVQITNLNKGIFSALVAQDPYGLGYDSVTRLAKAAAGNLDLKSLKHQEYVNALIITTDNVTTKDALQHIYDPQC